MIACTTTVECSTCETRSEWRTWCGDDYTLSDVFSSRRRHTRWSRDWSSGVCSSDLMEALRVTMATQGEECLTACTIYHNMGGILFSKGDFAAAKPYGEKAWELSQRLLGESDPRTMADEIGRASCRERV